LWTNLSFGQGGIRGTARSDFSCLAQGISNRSETYFAPRIAPRRASLAARKCRDMEERRPVTVAVDVEVGVGVIEGCETVDRLLEK